MQAAQRNVGQKKQALKLQPTLTVPVARNSRPTNKDGATSFHFKHEAIAKCREEKVSASGTKVRKHSGRDHAKYLERESAVARTDANTDRQFVSDDATRAANVVGRAAAGGLYIEREEALAYQENGVAAVYSNISQFPEERHRFWESVEEHETEPGPDRLIITTGYAPAFWQAVRTDPRCPERLALAIEEADPLKPHRVTTDDNEAIRVIMRDHGWTPPSARQPDETPAEKEMREKADLENAKGAQCQDGRGGHIQNRIVGELPDEVTHEQRIRLLRRFAGTFEEKNLPYVAVMHAPDHANNEKNWHFHLAYYERPCSRFTRKPDDYLQPTPIFTSSRQEAQYRVKQDFFTSDQVEQQVGQWDFTVEYSRRKRVSRNTIVSHPFEQDKLRLCNHRDWPWTLRKLLAEYTNDELEIAGVRRRVDPREFSEMGINKEAEEHLGSRCAQMECLGVATPRGVENEHRQWQHALNSIEQQFRADEGNTKNDERRLRQMLESRELGAAAHGEIDHMITTWAQARSEANEQTAIAAELKGHLERARSRAEKVKETCERHLDAIKAGRASKRQSDNEANYRTRLKEATDHLSGLRVNMAFFVNQEQLSRNEAARLTELASEIRQTIDDRLRDELVIHMSMVEKADGRESIKSNGHNESKAGSALDRSRSTVEGHAGKAVEETAREGALQAGQGIGGANQSLLANNADLASGALHLPAAAAPTHEAAAARSTGSEAEPLSLTQVMRKIDDIDSATPITRQMKDGAPVFDLPALSMKALGVTDGDLQATSVQARLSGIYRLQQAEINRLVGFIRRSPERTVTSAPTVFSNNRPAVGLAANGPPDLRALSQKYARHPGAQAQMSDALHEAGAARATTQAAELRPAKSEPRKAEGAPDSKEVEAPRIAQTDAVPQAPPFKWVDTAPEEGGMDRTKSLEVPAGKSKAAVHIESGKQAPMPRPAELSSDVMRDVEQLRRGLQSYVRDGRMVVLLEPREAQLLRLTEADQLGERTQVEFRRLFEQQEDEHKTIIEALNNGLARVREKTDLMGRSPPTYHLQAADAPLTDLFRLHQHNAGLQIKLRGAFEAQQRRDLQREALGMRTANREVPPLVMSETDRQIGGQSAPNPTVGEEPAVSAPTNPQRTSQVEIGSIEERARSSGVTTGFPGGGDYDPLVETSERRPPTEAEGTETTPRRAATDHGNAFPHHMSPLVEKAAAADVTDSVGKASAAVPGDVPDLVQAKTSGEAPTNRSTGLVDAEVPAADRLNRLGEPSELSPTGASEQPPAASQLAFVGEAEVTGGTEAGSSTGEQAEPPSVASDAVVERVKKSETTGPTMRQLQEEWDQLGLSQADTLEAIERDRRPLIMRDDKVSFAKPDEASAEHRLCLRISPTSARRLFAQQERRTEQMKVSANLAKQHGGIGGD